MGAQEPPRWVELPKVLVEDGQALWRAPGAWRRSDWNKLALALSAVLGTALILDRPLRDELQRHSSKDLDRFARGTVHLGPKASMALLGGLWVAGALGDRPRLQRGAVDGLMASLLTGALLVPVLKEGLGRARPNEGRGAAYFAPLSGRESFPSGHTTQAFAVAAVLAEHHPEGWVPWVAYGAASLVGLGRMVQDSHWASDVLAGALLGSWVGRTVVKVNARATWRVVPELRPGYRGATLALRF